MNRIDLEGRVAVVTGGAQGIGYAIAERMLASGAAVSLWDLDAGKLAEAKSALGHAGKVFAERVELTSDADVAAASQRTIAAAGKIDIVVNNAGIPAATARRGSSRPTSGAASSRSTSSRRTSSAARSSRT